MRLIFRAGALVAWTLGVYLAYLAGLALLLPWPERRRRWRDAAFRTWSRGCARLIGMRVEVEGSPPRPPFFLVANHLSYLDVLVLASRRPAVFVAKAEVRGWPFFGLLCRSVGTIFIDRGSRRDLLRVSLAIEEALARGDGVVVFAEGTTTPGREVARLKPALLDLPARKGLPVHFASLSYRTDGGVPARLAVCWWDDTPFLAHLLQLLRLPRFSARLRLGPEPLADSDRKRLAVRLHRAISERFVPVGDALERA